MSKAKSQQSGTYIAVVGGHQGSFMLFALLLPLAVA